MSDKDKRGNRAEFHRAMGRLEDAVKELGDAAKDNFADRAAEVLEQTAAKLKSDAGGSRSNEPYADPTKTFDESNSDRGRLGHWRGEGAPRPFRDLDNGRIWGICAGIAPYLGLEVWVVRCLAVTAFIFAPQIIVPAYIIGYFVLDARSELDELIGNGPRPTARMRRRHARNQRAAAKAEARVTRRARRSSASKTTEAEPILPARNVLRTVRGTLNEAELRLRRMEGHVTSGRYELQKELRKIES